MKAREFFKSTAFRCIVTLLLIVLIAGGILAIAHDLLSVSDEERLDRSLAKLYGGSATISETILSAGDGPVAVGQADVTQAYRMSDGGYLVQSVGKNGYRNGTVTVWVVFVCEENGEELSLLGIERVVYESNDNQSYIGRITAADYALFGEHDAELIAGMLFSAEPEDGSIYAPKTGASAPYTFHALVNAVNGAVVFFREQVIEGGRHE